MPSSSPSPSSLSSLQDSGKRVPSLSQKRMEVDSGGKMSYICLNNTFCPWKSGRWKSYTKQETFKAKPCPRFVGLASNTWNCCAVSHNCQEIPQLGLLLDPGAWKPRVIFQEGFHVSPQGNLGICCHMEPFTTPICLHTSGEKMQLENIPVCGGLNEKCPSQSPVFECLVLGL